MKMLLTVCLLILPVATILYNALPTRAIAPMQSTTQRDELIRASVSGFGTTPTNARGEAERNAREVANGSYRVLSTRISGSNGSFQCVMVIEYRRRS